MLQELYIENYAVIDSLRLEFYTGLNLLSGETGSGKSILIDALGLALGDRATPDVVRTGEERASVTAVFRAEGVAPWVGRLEEWGLSGGDDSEIFLRREVHSNGKSRLLVNEKPATLATVKGLAPLLVEVLGQSEHALLFSREAQRKLLDEFADVGSLVGEVAELFAERRELERVLQNLNQSEEERLRTLDLLQFQVQELDRAGLRPGEENELDGEKTILVNLERIRLAASTAYDQLYEDEGSAGARLAAVSRAVEDLARYDSSVEPHLETLLGIRARLDDLAFFLRDYLDRLEADPNRLEKVEDRLALIAGLRRKYGKTVEELLIYKEEIHEQLSRLEHATEHREEVKRELDGLTKKYREVAGKLSQHRRGAALKLQMQVQQELAQVGMDKTRFEVCLESLPEDGFTAYGIDHVELLISPNPGEALRPLEKVASGGELSRLLLGLKTVVGQNRFDEMTARNLHAPPTFVFDEVDAGIGGRVAESVGVRLKRLARGKQVLCVSHLPQIACFADHHFVVEKIVRQGRTVTTVEYLRNQKDRVQELARMLSGKQITETALKHAAAMLKQGTTL